MAKTTQNNDVMMAVLAYFLFFLPIVAAKESKLAMFHANQSLVLLIVWVVSVFIGVIPVLGWIISPVLGIAAFILWIMGVVQAAQGQMNPLPVVGTIKILK